MMAQGKNKVQTPEFPLGTTCSTVAEAKSSRSASSTFGSESRPCAFSFAKSDCHSFETVTVVETAKSGESERRTPNATARKSPLTSV